MNRIIPGFLPAQVHIILLQLVRLMPCFWLLDRVIIANEFVESGYSCVWLSHSGIRRGLLLIMLCKYVDCWDTTPISGFHFQAIVLNLPSNLADLLV